MSEGRGNLSLTSKVTISDSVFCSSILQSCHPHSFFRRQCLWVAPHSPSSSRSSPLGVASPLQRAPGYLCVLGMRCCCSRLLPLASYLHLLQSSADRHLSVSCFYLSVLATSLFLYGWWRQRAPTADGRGWWGERGDSLWSIEDAAEPEKIAGWVRNCETHITHRGLSKSTPRIPSSFPLSHSLSPSVCRLQEQPPHHFFRAAASALSSLPPLLASLSPSLLLAPLWECSEGKRIIDTYFLPQHQQRIYDLRVAGCGRTAHGCARPSLGGNQSWVVDVETWNHLDCHHPGLAGGSPRSCFGRSLHIWINCRRIDQQGSRTGMESRGAPWAKKRGKEKLEVSDR